MPRRSVISRRNVITVPIFNPRAAPFRTDVSAKDQLRAVSSAHDPAAARYSQLREAAVIRLIKIGADLFELDPAARRSNQHVGIDVVARGRCPIRIKEGILQTR